MANANQKKYDYMLECNKNHMDLTALSFGNREITYEELHDRIEKYAKILYSKGVREGDKIGICALNVPESVYLIYALDYIGAIAIGLSPLDNKEKLKKDIELTKPKMIITVDMKYSNFKEYEKALNFSTILYSIADQITDPKLRIGYKAMQISQGNFTLSNAKNLKKLAERDYSNVTVTPSQYVENQLSDIMFTGGSSGIHKGVDLSGNGINNVIEGMKYIYDDDFFTGKTYLGNIPMGHMVYGRVILHIALTNNMNYALTLKALPKDFYEELVRTQAFAAVGGPPHWTSLIEKDGEKFVPRKDLKLGSLSNLHLATSGGEAKKQTVDAAINEALKFCGSKTVLGDGLGATEAWSVMTLNSGNYYTPNTIGSPISTLDVKLVNPTTGETVKKGEKGLLYVSGPSVMLGYHNNVEETNKVITIDEQGKKWCNTGDYLREIADNTYEYVGRQKRNFVSGIENVYPEQLEELLVTIPEIREVVVTKLPDDMVQYIPRYHISLYDGNIDYEDLRNKIDLLVKSKLSENWLPGSIEFTVEPLNRMSNSKVDVNYYQEKDNEDFKNGLIDTESAKILRIKKM